MRKLAMIAVLSAVCAMAFAGCTGGLINGSTTKGRDSSEQETTSGMASSESERTYAVETITSPVFAEATTGSYKYKTLNDWYMDNKESLDKSAESTSTDAFTCEIKCDGSALCYEYTYLTQLSGDAKTSVSSTLYDALNGTTCKNQFNRVVDSLKDYIEGSCSVRVIYYNADGSMLAQKTYLGSL